MEHDEWFANNLYWIMPIESTVYLNAIADYVALNIKRKKNVEHTGNQTKT